MKTNSWLSMVLAQQTPSARKVFFAVPIEEAWSSRRIAQELSRTGVVKSLEFVEGCLENLHSSKLVVKRVSPSSQVTFQRAAGRVEPERSGKQMGMQKPSAAESTLTERLEAFNTKLAALADTIIEMSDEFAKISTAVKTADSVSETELMRLRALRDAIKANLG